MTRDIGVWLSDQSVGVLSSEGGRLGFQYRADWLTQPNAVALSQSLPLRPERFDSSQGHLDRHIGATS